MRGLRQTRRRRSRVQELNITPLIDMVFILLIFFLVTTSFVKESGVDVERPMARTAEVKDQNSLLIGVDRQGIIHIGGNTVDIRSIKVHVKRYLAANPQGAVVIVADKASHTGTVIQVLDECRETGAGNLSLAARKPEE